MEANLKYGPNRSLKICTVQLHLISTGISEELFCIDSWKSFIFLTLSNFPFFHFAGPFLNWSSGCIMEATLEQFLCKRCVVFAWFEGYISELSITKRERRQVRVLSERGLAPRFYPCAHRIFYFRLKAISIAFFVQAFVLVLRGNKIVLRKQQCCTWMTNVKKCS